MRHCQICGRKAVLSKGMNNEWLFTYGGPVIDAATFMGKGRNAY